MNNGITVLKCPNCDANLTEGAACCEYCGTRFAINKKHAEIPNFTINISTPNTSIETNNATSGFNNRPNKYLNMKKKNKWVAFLLCLFLGFLGAHKFYENKVGMGILYIFTSGLFGIGWLIDIFVLLALPNPYYVH